MYADQCSPQTNILSINKKKNKKERIAKKEKKKKKKKKEKKGRKKNKTGDVTCLRYKHSVRN